MNVGDENKSEKKWQSSKHKAIFKTKSQEQVLLHITNMHQIYNGTLRTWVSSGF